MRDAVEVIDNELAEVAADARRDIAARLAEGGRIVAARDGVVTLCYRDSRGSIVTKRVATLADLAPTSSGKTAARAA